MVHICDAIMGSGKAQPLTSPVLTESGYLLMGEVKAGMKVYGEDGKLHKVSKVFPQGRKPVYRVTFSDGSSTLCCKEHLWTCKVDDSEEWQTLSIEEIKADSLFAGSGKNKVWRYSIPVAKAMNFDGIVPEEKALSYNDLVDIVMKRKVMPFELLYSSTGTRFAALTMICGYREHMGDEAYLNDEFTCTVPSVSIAMNVRWLVNSLGGIADMPVITSHEGRDGNCIYECSVTCHFGKYARRSITSIDKVGRMLCQCILVDSESHLYITNDFIVTHNTSATIDYINTHKNKKYIYITPYLDEAKRIREGCPDLKFVEPHKVEQFNFRKIEHLEGLIREGRNITSTHALFKYYDASVLSYIREQGYTLFIDENIDMIEEYDCKAADIDLLVSGGYLTEKDNVFYPTERIYRGSVLKPVFELMKSRRLVRFTKSNNSERMLFWVLPPELINSFKDVFVLTYLFEGQGLYNFLKLYNIPYTYIGIHRDKEGGYHYGTAPGDVPEYVSGIKNLINIVDVPKLNEVGDKTTALSATWLESRENVSQLKRNILNCFTNVWKDSKAGTSLWTTYKSAKSKLKGKGYTNSFLSFNTRATNSYVNRQHLVYAVNVYPNVNEKIFFKENGVEIDNDKYALSTMVQWIWRSRIRVGEPIDIYIPSRRMRTLLVDWMNSLEGGDSK